MARDYGGFEKVGDIGYTLPQNNTQITTQAGDVILYQGRSICLYYDTNSWNFTRIGKINGYSEFEMRSLLGAGKGSVQIAISFFIHFILAYYKDGFVIRNNYPIKTPLEYKNDSF